MARIILYRMMLENCSSGGGGDEIHDVETEIRWYCLHSVRSSCDSDDTVTALEKNLDGILCLYVMTVWCNRGL